MDGSGKCFRDRYLWRLSRVGEAQLLVIEANISPMFALPALGGIVAIVRAPEVEFLLHHSSVPRKRARIVAESGGAEITDLDRQNGTWVNVAIVRGAHAARRHRCRRERRLHLRRSRAEQDHHRSGVTRRELRRQIRTAERLARQLMGLCQ